MLWRGLVCGLFTHARVSSRRHVSRAHTWCASRTWLLMSLPSQRLSPPAFSGSGDPILPVSVGRPWGHPQPHALPPSPSTSKPLQVYLQTSQIQPPVAATMHPANTRTSSLSSLLSPNPPRAALQPALSTFSKRSITKPHSPSAQNPPSSRSNPKIVPQDLGHQGLEITSLAMHASARALGWAT